MDEDLDVSKLTKLYSKIHNPKVDVEFSNDEVQEFNNYVHNKDISSIVKLFESKENIGWEVLKDIVNEKTEGLWQFVMDHAYDKWKSSEMSREDFLNQLTDYERLAVMFGNFNYQVENGGLYQWHDNDYSEDLGSLYDFLDNCDYDKKDKFMQVLDDFSYVKTAIEELDPNNDWYNDDCQTRLETLKYYDKDYYSIQDDWKDYFENYLITNIPDEYVQMIYQLERNINV